MRAMAYLAHKYIRESMSKCKKYILDTDWNAY